MDPTTLTTTLTTTIMFLEVSGHLKCMHHDTSMFEYDLLFTGSIHERYGLHPMAHSHHLYPEPTFIDTDSVLQVIMLPR